MNTKKLFDIVVKTCSIIVLVSGLLLILYIFLGPSLGLIDPESASFGILLAAPVIISGVISIALSFSGHTKASAIVIILFALVIGLNVWNENRISSEGRQRMIEMQALQNHPIPPVPQNPTTK